MPQVILEFYKDRGLNRKHKTFMSEETYEQAHSTDAIRSVGINKETGRTCVWLGGSDYSHDVVGSLRDVVNKINEISIPKITINNPLILSSDWVSAASSYTAEGLRDQEHKPTEQVVDNSASTRTLPTLRWGGVLGPPV